MSQARRKNPSAMPLTHHVSRGVREGILLILSTVALYLLISLLSYNPQDPGWSQSGTSERVFNLGGAAGAWFSDVFLYLFGYLAYLFPAMVAYSGWILFRGRDNTGDIDIHTLSIRWFGFFLTVIAGCGLFALIFNVSVEQLPLNAGGVLGDLVSNALESRFSFIGAALFLLALSLTGVTLFTGLSWLLVMDLIGKTVLSSVYQSRLYALQTYAWWKGYQSRKKREVVVKAEKKRVSKRKPIKIEPLVKKVTISERIEKERQVPLFDAPANSELPPLMLLDDAPPAESGYSAAALEAMSRLLEIKLQDFGVEAEVVEVQPGPIITRFELQPGQGVKASRITNLAKDLARSLAVSSVRVVEVIVGKSVIGIEIPNEQRELIALSEILKSQAYDASQSPLTLTLGKDIGGNPVVVDLAKMPHLLVAGTTGSGKSVAVNAMILSLLYKTLPKDVRMILIDPKMLELSVYEGIPHLLTPVVTDMNEAASALRWCVVEMERRYKLMASLGVRNIVNYNRKVKEAEAQGEPIKDPLYKREEAIDPDAPPPVLTPLPHIVIVIDELADMMMVVGKKVEELIARLAQKARAAGVHLILATQRPSVDVITGLIKANIPTRIAFQVSSRIDSRTILDQGGAEQLLGHGDMLYLAPGTGLPMRVHGAFVSDQEVNKVAAHLKKGASTDYIEEVLQTTTSNLDASRGVGDGSDAEADALYDEAVRIVTETRKASISGVQRRLKIGYNRAARMVEHMEEVGIVSPLQSNGSREVLAPPPVQD